MTKIFNMIYEILWGPILIPLLLGTGIYYTFNLRFIQVRKIGAAFKQVFGGMFNKKEKADKDGMSSFQALATAVAAQVGTGNLAGVATAIVSGGPGAIFWMWVSALLGMATNFGEAILGQIYKERVGDEITGGPAYYIRKGINSKFLAGFFAISIIIALGFIGNMVQSNSIAEVVKNAINVKPIFVGIITAILAGIILIGGISRIASFTEKVVPIMALVYILGSLGILIINIDKVIPAFKMIFVGAFNPKAVGGGALGITVMQAARYGIARGLFSNEAGMGSTPHAHAVAKVKHPAEQGLAALVGVTIDTVIICTITALVILTSGTLDSGLTGSALTQNAFKLGFGNIGVYFIAISLFFFAFSTIIGWYFFGEANIKYLFGEKGIMPYRLLVLAFLVVGSVLEVKVVWQLADIFNGLMVFPNLIALLLLSYKVKDVLKDYENKYLRKLDSVYLNKED
ncbi:sodium:alanine symporter family protein [Gottschalkia purinilytica]|uniref:Sodium:alanine symporter family protein n=1 Tax=Gottschalkia purinilytica TaxID=1503 RepID=A0A0L0WDX5_GOTPU|nr:sodium:alanine symporter family protein [Gottschalkia purinilytica]KNF09620.1 sodium:alanine symporter family protein [Gottschalkia purinilytica]